MIPLVLMEQHSINYMFASQVCDFPLSSLTRYLEFCYAWNPLTFLSIGYNVPIRHHDKFMLVDILKFHSAISLTTARVDFWELITCFNGTTAFRYDFLIVLAITVSRWCVGHETVPNNYLSGLWITHTLPQGWRFA